MSLPYFDNTSRLNGFKPCPFCGRTSQTIYIASQSWGKHTDTMSFIIKCACGLDYHTGVYAYGKPDKHQNEIKARKRLIKVLLEAWNDRRA